MDHGGRTLDPGWKEGLRGSGWWAWWRGNHSAPGPISDVPSKNSAQWHLCFYHLRGLICSCFHRSCKQTNKGLLGWNLSHRWGVISRRGLCWQLQTSQHFLCHACEWCLGNVLVYLTVCNMYNCCTVLPRKTCQENDEILKMIQNSIYVHPHPHLPLPSRLSARWKWMFLTCDILG